MFQKIIDKLLDPIEFILLKPLKINTNEFFAYVLGAIGLALGVDRLVQYFRVFFTGEFTSYWSPIGYLFAMLCPFCAYVVLCASPKRKTLRDPMHYFVFFSLILYAIVIGMMAQWTNEVVWYVLMRSSNFKFICGNMPEIVAPAVGAISILPPFFTFKTMWKYYIGNVVDGDKDWIESFEDFKGFKLEAAYTKVELPRAYFCDAPICLDEKTGKMAMIPEKTRFEATVVEGATGTGKTATVVEPMCANDIERKFFFREISKKMAHHALTTGMAELNVPYNNDYLNHNFTLNFLTPRNGRENEFKNYVKDMIKYEDPETKELFFRNIGFTLVAPDNACIERIQKVAKAYNMHVNIIDPTDPNSFGINPFTGKDPAKIAAIISTVLKAMNEADGGKDDTFFQSVAQQAFENLAILLKLIYPRMHNGETPTLEDMLAILNNFDIAEEMCEVLKKDTKLAEEYSSLIGYFEKNFYKPPVNIHGYEIATTYGAGRKKTEEVVYGAITQLDNFLRNPGVKRVLCSRNHNVDFDQALQNGEIITVCTRQGALGEIHQRAFGMFFILSFKDAVLRRPGVEDSRTPHFVYIDEFPMYVNKDVEAFFTLFRKYRCGTLITIQNLSQLSRVKALDFRDIVLTNTKSQVVFGDLTADESEFWAKELGNKKQWNYRPTKVLDDTTQEGEKAQTEAYMGSKQEYVPNYKAGKIFNLKFKQCVYRTKDKKGGRVVGLGATDFIKSDYYKEHKMSEYDFEAFGHTNNSNANANTSENLLFGDMPQSNVSSGKDYNSGLNSNSSSGIDEFGTSKVDNSKIEDIYIDLDGDGINDLSYADPIVAGKDDNQGKKTKTKKNGDSDDAQLNILDATSDSDDSAIIKF
ncbi:MAG: type IV secretory system conjugative DNA transfer family protein [Clostridia bacterium]|nr:type IV secretory system conjugative DNA transfer family protein [Clostridia bacterium]